MNDLEFALLSGVFTLGLLLLSVLLDIYRDLMQKQRGREMSKPMRDFIFPKEAEFPDWSDDLRGMATEFWWKWIGPNTVGYDEAVQDIGELIDFALSEGGEN